MQRMITLILGLMEAMHRSAYSAGLGLNTSWFHYAHAHIFDDSSISFVEQTLFVLIRGLTWAEGS